MITIHIGIVKTEKTFTLTDNNMEFDAIILNLFGEESIVKMMEQDGLAHNKATKLTPERLFELSKRYDVTIRTNGKLTRVFIAEQATFLPGDYSEQQ